MPTRLPQVLPQVRLLRFGVIGYGYWGPHLVRNISALPDSSLAFIADMDVDRLAHAQAQYHYTRFTHDALDVFESDIDAVLIATPVHTHYALARAALLANKHVFVEKPLAVKVSEVEDLVALAQERNRILMVGYTFLYHKAVQELRHIVTEGQLGKLHYIDAQRLNLGLFHKDVNVLWDLAPHDLSILRYLLDADPVTVRATGAAHIQQGIHDVVYIHLRYADGLRVHIQLSWLHPSKVRRFTLVGDQRMAVYDDVEPQDKIRIYNRGVERPNHCTAFDEFHLSYRTGEIIIPAVPWIEPLQVACAHFAHCIRSEQPPLSNGLWSLSITKTLAAIQQSLDLEGKEVAL
ncbi:MAG TPA: Gfo/Idh/MocA family oxidoreductase [Ktedonobacterales bacterium]|nr:Gfo/Idh/MocA family oxidoreductase [Ktedonobacterales bacterium]